MCLDEMSAAGEIESKLGRDVTLALALVERCSLTWFIFTTHITIPARGCVC
jgi:hypothetical protein